MDEETRNKVLAKMTTERDLRNQMRYARNEAIEEGLAEGRAEAIRKMLEAKLPIEQVAAIMEMSVEEIHNLE